MVFCGIKKTVDSNKQIFLYCPKGHGSFTQSQVSSQIPPKCPTCGEILHEMKGVIQK